MLSGLVLDFVTHYISQHYYRWILPPAQWPCVPEPSPLVHDAPPDQMDWDEAIAIVGHQPWLSEQYRQRLVTDRMLLGEGIRQQLGHLKELAGWWVGYSSPFYPKQLKEIRDPPAAVFVLGNIRALQQSFVAVVGARKASVRSLRWSRQVGRELAEAGIPIVSGGAFGCDIHAHVGMLAAKTANGCVVFAGGLKQQYPARFRPIYRQVLQHGGVLVSERLLDCPPRNFDFPVRNRIIAGMSHLVIVVQAAARSGSLITARLALEQGREVRVRRLPDQPDVRFGGNAMLLDEGAPIWSLRHQGAVISS